MKPFYFHSVAFWSIRVLMVIILVFMTGGCASQPLPTPPEPNTKVTDYYPLKVGNLWKYEGIGNEFAGYTAEVIYESENKYQVIVNNGGTSTVNRYEIINDSILHTFREHEFYDKTNILSNPPNLDATILTFPIQVGNTWMSEQNTYEIVDTNSTVQVPVGLFEGCITVKVTYKDSGNSSLFYYKKGIGLIKSEYVMPGQDSVISQLEEYKLN